MLSSFEERRINGLLGFSGGSVVKNPPAEAGDEGDAGSIPGSGKSPRGGHGNPLQYSCQENPMDTGAWWAIVSGVTKSRTSLATDTHRDINRKITDKSRS